jgi:ribosome-associated protein
MTLPALGDPPDSPDVIERERPSKTRLKKAMHELQDLGEALVALPEDRVAAVALPESLLSAVQEFKRTRSHEGRRRQMQYIGKLMRRVDAEPIRQAVAAMRLGQAKDALALHQAEDWRDRLLSSDDALAGWTAAFPTSDLQHLRSLVRAARKDAAAAPGQRSGRAFRELFRHIRQSQTAPPVQDA